MGSEERLCRPFYAELVQKTGTKQCMKKRRLYNREYNRRRSLNIETMHMSLRSDFEETMEGKCRFGAKRANLTQIQIFKIKIRRKDE